MRQKNIFMQIVGKHNIASHFNDLKNRIFKKYIWIEVIPKNPFIINTLARRCLFYALDLILIRSLVITEKRISTYTSNIKHILRVWQQYVLVPP